MRTSRQQLIEEPATLADRTANGAGAQCERVPALEEAARNAVEELAYTPMNLPLEDWSRISSTVLSALETSNRPGTFDLDQIAPDQLVNISRPESQRALEPSAARKELMKQIREGTARGFLNDGSQPEGNPDLDCPYCCGSGHKGDVHPSAARSLAMEERLQAIEQQLVVNLGYFHDEKRILLETLQSHIISHISAIRALSSQDHADAGKVEGDGDRWRIFEDACARGYWGIELEQAGNDDEPLLYPIKVHRDTLSRIVEAHNAAHFQEREAWPTIESAPKDGTEIWGWNKGAGPSQTRFYGGEWCCVDWDEDQYIACTWEPSHWRRLPSTPSQEVAG